MPVGFEGRGSGRSGGSVKGVILASGGAAAAGAARSCPGRWLVGGGGVGGGSVSWSVAVWWRARSDGVWHPGGRGSTGEAKRRWWAITADPQLASITAKRAYAEVLFVYLSFFAVGIIVAALLLAGRGKDLPTTGSWGIYLTNAVAVLTEVGLAVVLVLLLSARRGVSAASLGLCVPWQPDGRLAVSKTIRVAVWCFFAIGVGAVINALTQSGHLPTNHLKRGGTDLRGGGRRPGGRGRGAGGAGLRWWSRCARPGGRGGK